MSKIPIFLTVGFLFLGYRVYDLEEKSQHFITVDLNAIIQKTAQTFAKQKLSDTQLQRRLSKFRHGLEQSLKEFGALKKSIILPKSGAYGALPDQTDAFVVYHNGALTNVHGKNDDAK
jgi:hypothetical protein